MNSPVEGPMVVARAGMATGLEACHKVAVAVVEVIVGMAMMRIEGTPKMRDTAALVVVFESWRNILVLPSWRLFVLRL